MLIPANFDKGKMVASNVEKFVKDGWIIGHHAWLKRRITIKYGTKENDRKDIAAGTKVAIKAFVGSEHIVCTIEVQVSKKRSIDVDWKLPADGLLQEEPKEGDSKEADSKKTASKFQFVDMSNGDVDIYEDWEDNQFEREENFQKDSTAFTLDHLLAQMPIYGPKDLCVLKRGSRTEVWTMKEFAPGDLQFGPESTEIKARHWSQNRSAIAKNTASGDKRSRPCVIDGRVRGAVEGKSPFGLFWILRRAPKEEKAKQNMEIVYTTAEMKLKLDIDGKKVDCDMAIDKMPSIPILVNKNKIKKHTELVTLEDQELQKLYERLEADKEKDEKKRKEAENADEAAKKKHKASASAADANEAPGKKGKKGKGKGTKG